MTGSFGPTTLASAGPSCAPVDRAARHDIDRALVEAHRAGDVDAFSTIVHLYHQELLRHARRALGDSSDIEDLVQEAFLRAYRDRKSVV